MLRRRIIFAAINAWGKSLHGVVRATASATAPRSPAVDAHRATTTDDDNSDM